MIEGSVEWRVPLGRLLGGVVFADGAYVGTSGLAVASRGKGAVTPGVGLRYRSPLGVLRLDFGLRPVGAETLPVVVSVLDAAGQPQVVQLAREKRFSIIINRLCSQFILVLRSTCYRIERNQIVSRESASVSSKPPSNNQRTT